MSATELREVFAQMQAALVRYPAIDLRQLGYKIVSFARALEPEASRAQ